MAAGDTNDFIYRDVNWVAGDPNRIIFQRPLGSMATKFDIIFNGLYFNTAWGDRKIKILPWRRQQKVDSFEEKKNND